MGADCGYEGTQCGGVSWGGWAPMKSEWWGQVKRLLVTSGGLALKASCPLEGEPLSPVEAGAQRVNVGNMGLR